MKTCLICSKKIGRQGAVLKADPGISVQGPQSQELALCSTHWRLIFGRSEESKQLRAAHPAFFAKED